MFAGGEQAVRVGLGRGADEAVQPQAETACYAAGARALACHTAAAPAPRPQERYNNIRVNMVLLFFLGPTELCLATIFLFYCFVM